MLRDCLARPESWLRAGKYLSAPTRRNDWMIAEHADHRKPDKTQQLLNHAVLGTSAAVGVVRQFTVADLQQTARRSVLAATKKYGCAVS